LGYRDALGIQSVEPQLSKMSRPPSEANPVRGKDEIVPPAGRDVDDEVALDAVDHLRFSIEGLGSEVCDRSTVETGVDALRITLRFSIENLRWMVKGFDLFFHRWRVADVDTDAIVVFSRAKLPSLAIAP